MKIRMNGGTIAMAAGLAVFAVATWFAARTPTPPLLSSATGATSSTSDGKPDIALPVIVSGKTSIIAVTNPPAGIQWTIGKQNTISWNAIGGITGEIALVNATSGIVAGWIQQTLSPTQTSYSWNTEYVFSQAKIPSAQKPVLPGRYFIKIYFASSQVTSTASASFSIVAPTGTAQSSE
jgi:hypothetical protein